MSRHGAAGVVPGSANGDLPSRLDRGDHRWVLVLAGGSGERLAALTSDGRGVSVPKQYCSLLGGRSLLGDALARGDQLAPRQRVVTVVAREHAPFWRRDLQGWPQHNVVVQPQNRGTAAGVLLPLLTILARDAEAQVTVMPSDHFVADEAALTDALRAAQVSASSAADRVLLVGIEPDGPEVDYGWILPGPSTPDAVREVRRFVEKPDRQAALDLQRGGAVWNSFLVVGSACALLRLYAERLPELLGAFVQADVGVHPAHAERLYTGIGKADFCRHLLTGSETRLGLHTAPACGWTDLGTPARVAQCVASLTRGAGVELTHSRSLAAASERFLAPSIRRHLEATHHHA